MKLVNAIIAGFIAMLLALWVPMAGIFTGASMENNPALGSTIMYAGLLVSLVAIVLHIWGQIKYWKTPKGEKAIQPIVMMYAGIPLTLILLAGVSMTFAVMDI